MFSRVQKLVKPFNSFIKGSPYQLFSTTSSRDLDGLSLIINKSKEMQKTFQMIQEQKCFTSTPLESEKLIQFDKLIETPYSETFRGFDQHLNKFVSIKNVDLNFPDSWNHLQIALHQLQGKVEEAASFQEIFYNKNTQKMTLVRDCNYLLLSDYSQFKLKNKIFWKDNELLSLGLQLLFQIYSLEHSSGLGRISNQLLVQPQNIFLTPETFLLKFHDLYDFRFLNPLENRCTPAMRSVLSSLIRITNPLISVASHDQSYVYFKKNYPDFLNAFESLESTLNDIMISENKIEFQKLIETSNKGELFKEPEFESFVQNKLLTESSHSEVLVNFFSFSSKTKAAKKEEMNENAQNYLKDSLEAFEKALLLKDKLPSLDKSIIQQIEQECQKIEELLELTKRSVEDTSFGEIKNEHKRGNIWILSKALARDFTTKLNLIGVFKVTLAFTAVYSLFMIFLMALMLAAEKYGGAHF